MNPSKRFDPFPFPFVTEFTFKEKKSIERGFYEYSRNQNWSDAE